MLTVAVALAAGLGAVARYLVGETVLRSDVPFGTIAVNVSGSLLLGVVTGLSLHHGVPAEPTVIAGAGFLGGYTTLSTWAWETLELARRGELLRATANALGSVALGLAAAAAGLGATLLW